MKVKRYKCENCGAVKGHIDFYNDQYCYDCIDISTGKLKANGAGGKEMPVLVGEIKTTPPQPLDWEKEFKTFYAPQDFKCGGCTECEACNIYFETQTLFPQLRKHLLSAKSQGKEEGGQEVLKDILAVCKSTTHGRLHLVEEYIVNRLSHFNHNKE